MKRYQGLPFSTIVLAVISILILVLIVFFVTGGLSRLLPQPSRYLEEKQVIRAQCSNLLNDIKQRLGTGNYPDRDSIRNAFITSEFCSRKFKLENKDVNCFSPEIGYTTTFTVYTEGGTMVVCKAESSGCSCN